MAEEPEQVLPQDGAAIGRIVDVAAQLAVIQHTERGRGEHGENQQRQQRGDENVPRKDRQAEHGHAGGAEAQDRGGHIDRGSDGANTTDADAEDPQDYTDYIN